MAELLQDAALAEAAALALLLVPEAALLLELSLAQPARPALAASTAIAAIAATVICLIPASSSLPARSRELLSRTGGRVLPPPAEPSRGETGAGHPQAHPQLRRVARLPCRRAQRGSGQTAAAPLSHTPATSAGVARAKILASASDVSRA